MNTMGKLSNYISKGVNTISGPFHPFGGAIDIIVVEQPDGSFKSSPWYVRFGKFQGVLMARENVVNINVNGLEVNIDMHLDHRGEAFFLRELDGEEADVVIVSAASSDETDRRADKIRRPMMAKSCNYDSLNDNDCAENTKLGRSTSRRSRLMGMVFGRRPSFNESSINEVKDCSDIARLGSLERAEIAADLLDLHWTTNLATSRPRNCLVLPRSNLNGNNEPDKENIGLPSRDKTEIKSCRPDEVCMKSDYSAKPKVVPEIASFRCVTQNESSVLQHRVMENNCETDCRMNNVLDSEDNSSRFCVFHKSSNEFYVSSLDGNQRFQTACTDQVLSFSETMWTSPTQETRNHFFDGDSGFSSINKPAVNTVYKCNSTKDVQNFGSGDEPSDIESVSKDNICTEESFKASPEMSNAKSSPLFELKEPNTIQKQARVNTPTSEQLKSLNLHQGKNTVTFTFFSPMLGKHEVEARIYLWNWNTRVVISDVDGTITKSDVLGQFMPLLGVDWSQTGVTNLFSAIKENGYQLLFLSARAISQANLTRKFLFNINQNGKTLPDGPVVISPDGLFPSLFREVIRRAPHEFKIGCLADIKALFPGDCHPFYAGFGNRDTDEISYLKVGIPKGKIFIINPKGQVAVNRCIDTTSYHSLHGLVHGMFPSVLSSEQEDFNSWNFWKLPPPSLDA